MRRRLSRLIPRSLRARLIAVISCTALLIWGLSTAVAWWQVRKEVNALFDAQQILFAERLASANLHDLLFERRPPKGARRKRPHHQAYDDDALAFAVFSGQGDMLLHDGNNGEYLPFEPRPHHFSLSRLQGDDDPWRIFWLPVAGGRLMIAVGQEMDYRDDLSEAMVLSQMWIWFASLPLLLALIVWLVRRELYTLRQVGEAVAQRTPEDQGTLSTEVPDEILPLVNSLNHFFERTADQLLRERRFTSDAAHELRSPLAALKIQTEIAQLAGEDRALRAHALDNLTQGINRASQLIDQLLTLSRLDNLTQLDGIELIDWVALSQSLIGERYFLAQQRHIELQFEAVVLPPPQFGQPLLLSLLLRNLVDNAIKYSREGATVRISLFDDRIEVADNGGGVDDADLVKLGQRFYRPAGQNEKGSGLGLSIVRRIATLHHYTLTLDNRLLNGERGLCAALWFHV